MNLALLLALAILFVLAFSIGMNLGIHGVLTIGHSKLLPPTHRYMVPEGNVEDKDTKTPVLTGSPNGDLRKYIPPFRESVPLPTVPDLISSTVVSVSTIPSATVPPIIVTSSSKRVAKTSLEALNDIYSSEMMQQTISTTVQSFVSANEKPIGPIERYLASGQKIPIVLLTCNRPDQLTNTLKSLLAVRGVSKDNILVSQDGAMQAVADVVRKNGIKLLQNTDGLHLRGGAAVDGAERIARHYKFSLTAAFEMFKSPLEAPAMIIVEDDLLFSPDFYEYLASTAPILEKDPTTFVVSAWNDNGFKGRVGDPYALKRTEYFPGLGWLLPRALYKNELESRWPNQHWDHWLRSIEVHGTREIVYPEVPRTFHNGIQGTFMDINTHNKYFRDIDYNIDQDVTWDTSNGKRKMNAKVSSHSNDVDQGTGASKDTVISVIRPESTGLVPLSSMSPNYVVAMQTVHESRIESLIAQCTHLKSAQELVTAPPGVVCIWLDIDPTEPDSMLGKRPEFEPLAMFFGLWHEHRRGAHKGMHEFYYDDKYVLAINIRDRPGEYDNYRSKKPPNAVVLDPQRFDRASLQIEQNRKKLGLVGTPSTEAGSSCNQVCAKKGMKCRQDLLSLLNTCQALNEQFPCRDCIKSIGSDQPAYVSPNAPQSYSPGKCVYSTQPEKSTCDASHASTLRLCACA